MGHNGTKGLGQHADLVQDEVCVDNVQPECRVSEVQHVVEKEMEIEKGVEGLEKWKLREMWR